MDDVYQSLHIRGESEDSADILATLRAMHEGRLANDLKLVNYFHEVPLSYCATILSVEDKSVELQVHQHQAVAISLSKVTVLKSSHFPRDVIACVAYISVKRSVAVMSRFTYGFVRAERRMSVRVQVGDRLAVSFSGPHFSAAGLLHDISLTGLSVIFEAAPSIPLSSAGELTVALPGGAVTVCGTLIKTSEVEQGWRSVFQIAAGRPEEGIICRFIMRRQVEIIRALRDYPELVAAGYAV